MHWRDIEKLIELGLKRYIEGMSITYVLPEIESLVEISKSAKKRLAWMDYERNCGNIAKTCRYFGISRKTFHVWQKRYRPDNLATLESHSRCPNQVRTWMVTREEERRILSLRTRHIRYGKMKLAVIYQTTYGEAISSWKIQRVIQKHQLYYHPKQNALLRKKRLRNQPKKRIAELKKERRQGFLIALDTMVRYVGGQRRYILTGIDIHGKIAFARMYSGHGSLYAADFLRRMHYLLDGKIENIQTDNGSEFARYFRLAAEHLKLPHYYSRPHTPKDNAFDERFNRTLQDEFIALGNPTSDCAIFNRELTEWLVEYDFHRPHQSLGYLTPIAYQHTYSKVLPMYPSSTGA